ncbi:MAG: FKBP-type peptidyl-prolyl cis-trans isomerase [Myxococcales bacterium]|nr:FKBP-type peptidyl-prolyl cis-trans isomerase [Myxococcales bacterium]
MKIADGLVVSMEYDIRTADGRLIESSDKRGAPLRFFYGPNVMLPGLAPKLLGLSAGEEHKFGLLPEEAFGRIEDAPRRDIPRSEFPASAQIKEGMSFEAGLPNGQPIRLVVCEVSDKAVNVRMVHPLAGQHIKLRVKILEVREPTEEERGSGVVAAS